MARNLLLFGTFWILAILLQWKNGAYNSDLGGHADEPAHFVTGLMIRDYVAGPLWKGQSPISFAKNYYSRFPKVALGHYPPGFYLAEATCLLLHRSIAMSLVFCGFATAFTAWLTARIGASLVGWPLAIGAASAFCLFRIVQTYTAMVMSDILVVALCLLSLIAWARFLATRNPRWSLAFGGLAAAAILTKGSGLLLTFLPPLTLVLRRELRLFLNWRLWLAVAPVALLAFPWMLATAHITEEGMTGQSVGAYLREALPFFAHQSIAVFGPTVLILLGLSGWGLLWRWCCAPAQESKISPKEACLWALGGSVYLFYCLVPSGLDSRYLLPALPPALLLACITIRKIIPHDYHLQYWKSSVFRASLIVASAVLLVIGRHSAPAKQIHGPSRLVTELPTGKIVICSDPPGEGALIAAAALLRPNQLSVQRGTKVLSSSDWMRRDYKQAFKSPEDLVSLLQSAGIGWLVIDTSVPADRKQAHQLLIEDWTKGEAGQNYFKTVFEIPATRRGIHGSLIVYGVPSSTSN